MMSEVTLIHAMNGTLERRNLDPGGIIHVEEGNASVVKRMNTLVNVGLLSYLP